MSLGFLIALCHYCKDKNASLQDFSGFIFVYVGKQYCKGTVRKKQRSRVLHTCKQQDLGRAHRGKLLYHFVLASLLEAVRGSMFLVFRLC